MKKVFILLFLTLAVMAGYSQEGTSGDTSDKIIVTIMRQRGSIRLKPAIVYNQEVLCHLRINSYIDIEVPAGDNLFYLDSVPMTFDDAFLLLARQNNHYYLLVKEQILPVRIRELSLKKLWKRQMTFKQIEEVKANEMLIGMTQVFPGTEGEK
ncbi:MAG: hypothetical protein PQJ60_05170 [Spirochaetales bacterium]|nr:hypothetical protein [Spirochaetales bacterium]